MASTMETKEVKAEGVSPIPADHLKEQLVTSTNLQVEEDQAKTEASNITTNRDPSITRNSPRRVTMSQIQDLFHS